MTSGCRYASSLLDSNLDIRESLSGVKRISIGVSLSPAALSMRNVDKREVASMKSLSFLVSGVEGATARLTTQSSQNKRGGKFAVMNTHHSKASFMFP